MVKAVIFDMDGLMVDTEIISYKAYCSFLKEYGVEHMTKSEYCICFAGKSLTNGLLYARDFFKVNYTIEDGENFFRGREKELFHSDGVTLKPGLRELLDYLKENNIKMAMATSSNIERVHEILDPHDVLHYFTHIVCGEEVKHGKPAPDIFLKACDKLGVDSDDALVLEDSETGIQAAYSAHIPVICIPDMKSPDEPYNSMTTKILPSLHEVIDYLKG